MNETIGDLHQRLEDKQVEVNILQQTNLLLREKLEKSPTRSNLMGSNSKKNSLKQSKMIKNLKKKILLYRQENKQIKRKLQMSLAETIELKTKIKFNNCNSNKEAIEKLEKEKLGLEKEIGSVKEMLYTLLEQTEEDKRVNELQSNELKNLKNQHESVLKELSQSLEKNESLKNQLTKSDNRNKDEMPQNGLEKKIEELQLKIEKTEKLTGMREVLLQDLRKQNNSLKEQIKEIETNKNQSTEDNQIKENDPNNKTSSPLNDLKRQIQEISEERDLLATRCSNLVQQNRKLESKLEEKTTTLGNIHEDDDLDNDEDLDSTLSSTFSSSSSSTGSDSVSNSPINSTIDLSNLLKRNEGVDGNENNTDQKNNFGYMKNQKPVSIDSKCAKNLLQLLKSRQTPDKIYQINVPKPKTNLKDYDVNEEQENQNPLDFDELFLSNKPSKEELLSEKLENEIEKRINKKNKKKFKINKYGNGTNMLIERLLEDLEEKPETEQTPTKKLSEMDNMNLLTPKQKHLEKCLGTIKKYSGKLDLVKFAELLKSTGKDAEYFEDLNDLENELNLFKQEFEEIKPCSNSNSKSKINKKSKISTPLREKNTLELGFQEITPTKKLFKINARFVGYCDKDRKLLSSRKVKRKKQNRVLEIRGNYLFEFLNGSDKPLRKFDPKKIRISLVQNDGNTITNNNTANGTGSKSFLICGSNLRKIYTSPNIATIETFISKVQRLGQNNSRFYHFQQKN
ncbi:huntingtin interacting protein [Anaeramoeba flamelloides]|uniref:Huntingtin interacting protein n=1 Tax=Anaeramoeba flamelloides TaxID=1746091 RepID=A0ABQ8XEK9_9EUKA|nr:huntingtin interacting protein [Anaeramoeba flamelloides]